MDKLILILLCLPLFCNGQTSDRTLEPHASGEDVVNAVMEKIRSKCVLTDDKFFMRRIAAVETDFGKNSTPNNGGIWKVSKSILLFVKTNCQYKLRSVCNGILQKFFFDITKATMSQMDIPLYSGLVMNAYVSGLESMGKKVPASKSDQAVFWMKFIQPKGDTRLFLEKSSIKASCSAVKMDLVFAIDASGSVGQTGFNKTLTFLESVAQDLHISPDMTRVAIIRFSSRASISFNLDTYTNQSDIIDGISRILYTGGGTGTSIAIDLARNVIFKNARKNVPKVFVLITDGRSNSQSQTVAAANRLKMDDTTIFTIGIGKVNDNEMLAVASAPSCTHYFSLNSYSEIDAIIHEIQRESCEAPVSMDMTGANVNETVIDSNPIPSNNDTKIQNIDVKADNQSSSGNTTNIKVDVICGIVQIYASNDFGKPSAAIHAYSAIATDGHAGWIRSPSDKKLYLSLVSKKRWDLAEAECTNPHYNISFNPSDEGVTIVCRENGKERKCTADDIKHSFGPLCGDDNVPNPCTKTNILNNKMRFKHPKSLHKYIQCKLSGQMEIVKCPTGTQYDESQSVCDPQITSLPGNNSLYGGKNPCTKQAIMNGQFYFANPSDISSFIQCNEWGTAFLVHCPRKTAWSQQAYTCIHHSSTASTINPCKSSNMSHPQYHENPSDRKSFIQCDKNGNAKVVQCPLRTVWLQAKLQCVPDSISFSSTTTRALNASINVTTPPKRPTKCTYGEYLPHKDPHKYNVCEWDGKLSEMSCPAGLVWYQASKVCNWPSGSA